MTTVFSGSRSIGASSTGRVTSSCNQSLNIQSMNYTTRINNDYFHHPGNRTSWSRRSKPAGGNGYLTNRTSSAVRNKNSSNGYRVNQSIANKIGVNRLGNCKMLCSN